MRATAGRMGLLLDPLHTVLEQNRISQSVGAGGPIRHVVDDFGLRV